MVELMSDIASPPLVESRPYLACSFIRHTYGGFIADSDLQNRGWSTSKLFREPSMASSSCWNYKIPHRPSKL